MSARFDLASQVHATVDSSYQYATDPEVFGKDEFWEKISQMGRGDCEDFVLEKRARLLAAGVPISDLRIGVCQVSGEGLHAVLVIRDGDVDWISDQRQATLVTAEDLKGQGYLGVEIQVPGSFAWSRWAL